MAETDVTNADLSLRQRLHEPNRDWFERVMSAERTRLHALVNAMVPLMKLGLNEGPLQNFQVTVGPDTYARVVFHGPVSIREYEGLLAHIAFYKTMLPDWKEESDDSDTSTVTPSSLCTAADLERYVKNAVTSIIAATPMPLVLTPDSP